MGQSFAIKNPLTTANHLMVHGFYDGQRRGAAALAPRLSMPPGTLSNKVAPDNDAHLSPEHWVAAMIAADNFVPLQVAAHQCSHSAVPLPDMVFLSDMELLDSVLKANKEFGDLAAAVSQALDTGNVTPADLQHAETELMESVSAQFELVGRLRRLIPEQAR